MAGLLGGRLLRRRTPSSRVAFFAGDALVAGAAFLTDAEVAAGAFLAGAAFLVAVVVASLLRGGRLLAGRGLLRGRLLRRRRRCRLLGGRLRRGRLLRRSSLRRGGALLRGAPSSPGGLLRSCGGSLLRGRLLRGSGLLGGRPSSRAAFVAEAFFARRPSSRPAPRRRSEVVAALAGLAATGDTFRCSGRSLAGQLGGAHPSHRHALSKTEIASPMGWDTWPRPGVPARPQPAQCGEDMPGLTPGQQGSPRGRRAIPPAATAVVVRRRPALRNRVGAAERGWQTGTCVRTVTTGRVGPGPAESDLGTV